MGAFLGVCLLGAALSALAALPSPASAHARPGPAPSGTVQLAQSYLGDRTLERAPDFVVERYRDRAESGDARAQFYLGLMAEQGLITGTPDDAAARGWFERAARHGYPPAQYKLGVMLEEGRGGPPDAKGAATNYRQAADSGMAEAQYNYALMMSQGRGLPQDIPTAIRWFERAALAGVVEAQMALAEIHSVGVGVPIDPVEAWAWLKRAAEAGNAEALELLPQIEARMDEPAKEEARKLKSAHDTLAQIRTER
ncbi:sel1 repeat family protein [Marivibrio halodurans]|uniref:Sel1 repeat family protein n=1 Tax=Marivibrio halodurans TaxID=2039722 RepID=A0A8J7V2J1_9PROT|nr:sel1 repeat family protein [Marivibrio halodurans]